MYINRFFGYFVSLLILAGCTGTDKSTPSADWFDTYEQMQPGTPSQMYGTPSDGYGTHDTSTDTHHMAVLLPLSGGNAPIGKTIRTSVEMAILKNAPKNLTVSFYDTTENLTDTINTVLTTAPEIIVGPIFSGDAKTLRDVKPEHLPVLSFTSDADALGDGLMTMNLMPTNGVETIVREMKSDDISQFIILAPDTDSGHLMAGTAKNAANIYELPLAGIFYYNSADPDSIKNAASVASMHNARTAAHTRARQVLSDILTNERLTIVEKSNLNTQLEKLERTDTIGRIPYDAVLFLGNGDDTKSLASYLRYFDVSARDARFYGTTMWDGSDITHDTTMMGAKFATMPDITPDFIATYEQISGTTPNRLATFGYDATNMAIGMMYSDKSNAAYLLNPSGYMGTDGLFRIHPSGASERALRIVEIDGSGTPKTIKDAPTNFLAPLYNIEQRHISPAPAMDLQTPGIDPDDYIRLPERFASQYRSKTIGTNITVAPTIQKSEIVAILPTDDTTPIKTQNFTPIKLESVTRSNIDEYEIYED